MEYKQISGENLFDATNRNWDDFDNFEDTIDYALSQMRELIIKKQKDYDPMNIASEIGIAIRARDKVSRLDNLLNKDTEHVTRIREILADDSLGVHEVVALIDTQVNDGPENESIEDTWVDLANYGLIGLMYHNGAWGRPLKGKISLDESDVDEGNVY